MKTTEQVTEELNQLLKENNMILDVFTELRRDSIKHIVKVKYIVEPEMLPVETTPDTDG